ncbi:MAG TPA: TMEM175 family protein [Acetobacteraceae bacterium]|nr:TMEM175 family protein [Acetobacteraceae bacterium]
MAGDEGVENMAGTERLIAFSDGVFAVAITLLVLDVQLPGLPAKVSDAALTAALVSILPRIGAYVLSFLVVGELWFLHHMRFRYIHRCDGTLIWLNLLLLLTVSFVPFTSAVLSQYGNATAIALYDATMALAALLSAAMWAYATAKGHLVRSGINPRIRRRGLIGSSLVAGVFILSGVAAVIDPHAARWVWLLLLPAALRGWPGRGR